MRPKGHIAHLSRRANDNNNDNSKGTYAMKSHHYFSLEKSAIVHAKLDELDYFRDRRLYIVLAGSG